MTVNDVDSQPYWLPTAYYGIMGLNQKDLVQQGFLA